MCPPDLSSLSSSHILHHMPLTFPQVRCTSAYQLSYSSFKSCPCIVFLQPPNLPSFNRFLSHHLLLNQIRDHQPVLKLTWDDLHIYQKLFISLSHQYKVSLIFPCPVRHFPLLPFSELCLPHTTPFHHKILTSFLPHFSAQFHFLHEHPHNPQSVSQQVH